MANYFFVATALPPLQLGVPPDITFKEFVDLLKINLSAEDLAKTQVIRRFYDIQNIRALWKHEPLDYHGNLNLLDLEAALLDREGLPGYVFDFMDTYDAVKDRITHFPALTSAFFNQEIRRSNGFLKEFLQFEREWRLVLTGFRAKQLKRDLTAELQFEDPNDDFVMQILAQKDAKTFIAPNGYENLAILFEEHEKDPLALYQALCEYRFYEVEKMLNVDLFSIDRILGYLIQLIIVEKWLELDKKKGMDIVNQIVSEKQL